MKTLLTLVLFTLSPLVWAQAATEWLSPQGHEHPRLGQVLETDSGAWMDAEQLVSHLVVEPYVLVGEKHDNPDHHRLQLWLLEQLHARRPQAALAMEMLDAEQQALVGKLRGQPLPIDAELQRRLNWSEGWDWLLYGPLVRWGLATPRSLLAANLSRVEIRALYAEPVSLAPVYSEQARIELAQIMRDSHCNQLPDAQLPAMLAIQQGRDQRMAQVLKSAPTPVLLVAGGFHVRKDLGVPVHWLRETKPVVLMLVEAGSKLPGAHEADYAWITAATAARDYCADMR